MFFIIQTPLHSVIRKIIIFLFTFRNDKPFTAVGFSLTENINTIQSTKT